ncbi:hypothetical protein NJ7G_3630 [Natrinema sp. J7-2]|nr:hypothetical protein NJ7G_3630 [Natrinema sp. J7-2]
MSPVGESLAHTRRNDGRSEIFASDPHAWVGGGIRPVPVGRSTADSETDRPTGTPPNVRVRHSRPRSESCSLSAGVSEDACDLP